MLSNFLKGMGSINLFPENREIDLSLPYKTDLEALTLDRIAIEQDIANTFAVCIKEIENFSNEK